MKSKSDIVVHRVTQLSAVVQVVNNSSEPLGREELEKRVASLRPKNQKWKSCLTAAGQAVAAGLIARHGRGKYISLELAKPKLATVEGELVRSIAVKQLKQQLQEIKKAVAEIDKLLR